MTDKLKILCLHGYRQNAEKFSSQTGALRKLLKHEAEFSFLSAPHKIPDSEIVGDDQNQRAWWFTKPTSFSSRDETSLDKGLSESLETVSRYLQENGPFQGILGFSQGACLVSILCALKQKNEMNLQFDFAIIVSGFKSKCKLHTKYYEEKINIHSLHVIGETDGIIPADMCRELANVFVNPTIFVHPGGHYVPGKSIFKKDYVDFVSLIKKTNESS